MVYPSETRYSESSHYRVYVLLFWDSSWGVNAVLYYGPSIFENAGLSGGDSLFYQVLVGLVNTLTTILALLIIDKVGRKKLIYYGVSGMVVSLILIGSYFLFGNAWNISSLFLLAFFLLLCFCCAISICAVIFVLSLRCTLPKYAD